jgi:chemotaxis protein histidine kinase CheA
MNLSESVEMGMKEAVKNAVKEAVERCGRKYNFDASEALLELGLRSVLVVKALKVSNSVSIPLPFSGVIQEECCIALRQNSGLYTQCQSLKTGSSRYCNQCSKKGECEYGTVESRMAVGLQDYVDSKGRKQVHYTKIMKKHNLTEEQVMEVANKHGIKVDASHFIAPVDASKRGRPKSEKPAKVSSGVKGRPKKEKKVVEIAGDEEDLFANLVAQANRESVEEEAAVEESAVVESAVEVPVVESAVEVPVVEKSAAKVSKTAAEKAAEKAEKDAQKAAEKAEKDAQKAAEKAEKEAQKAAEKAAKDAEKTQKEAQKAAEKAAKETQKVEKVAQKVAQKVAEKAAKEDDQAEVVKKIEFAGHKYLKSKKTGIVYDYAEYVKTGDQIVVGQWNDETSAIDFKKACDDEEESEDEYEA